MSAKQRTAVLCLYCDTHARSQKNFENFAANGLVNNVDFFVAGSEDKLFETNYERSKFKELYFNDGEHDHQKFSRFYHDQIKKSDYQNVVVVSSRMCGPHRSPDDVHNWVQRFTTQLTTEIHLVGSTIAVMPKDHPLTKLQNDIKNKNCFAPYIPTSAFAISREGLDFLNKKSFFEQDIPDCELSLKLFSEMRMSDLLLENSWNISSLLSKYSNVDFRTIKKDPNPTSWIGDPSIENCYFGENIDKHESIFVETPDFEADCSKSHLKPPKNVELFGIFYDEQSRSAITNGFIPLDNSKGPKHLYESYPIMRQLNSNLPEEGTWCGFFSPKFHEKTQITVSDICNEIQQADEDVSVILFSSHWKQVALWPNIWLQGDTYHPGLLTLTEKVIDLAGYKIDIKKTYSTLNDGVFSNYLVAKKEFWLEWSRLVSIYYGLIANNDRLFTLSTPYQSNTVPIHTFVIERLASLIILELGLKTKFSQTLYDRSLNFNSVDGSEAIRTNQYKSKFNETGDELYVSLYNYHIDKINKRNKQMLMKKLLLRQQASCVA
jgi:hypothetical protein